MKKMKSLIALCLIVCICLSSMVMFASAADMRLEWVANEKAQLYSAEEVSNALCLSGQRSIGANAVLQDVLLPASMGIEIPNIDLSKIRNDTELDLLSAEFVESVLDNSTLSREEAEALTLSEYWELESSWLMPQDMIDSAKAAYPELNDVDMSRWTYGMYKEYYAFRDHENLLAKFTDQQLATLRARGVADNDIMYLFKEFHTAEAIMNQTDAALKNTIEGYYQFAYSSVVRGTDSINSTPPADKYTYVSFPRYGSDYFHNDVLTTEYWKQIQSDRALKTSQALYNTTSTTLSCTNMYGTYSYSQGGAHEGIDFTHPNGTQYPTIYAVFNGTKLSVQSTNGQLSVYDVNSPDEPKTYTYLHMDSITAGSNVSVGGSVGTQGKTGNATGCHVHFEVHRGNTTSLSSGADHVVGSLSPYRLQDYIGELD